MRSANLMLWMQRHSVAGMSSGLILWILVGIIIVVGAGSSPCASGYHQAGWSALELCLLIKCFLFWLHSSWWCIPKIPVSPSTWSSRLHLLLRVSLVFTKANGRLAVHMYQHYMGRPHVVHLLHVYACPSFYHQTKWVCSNLLFQWSGIISYYSSLLLGLVWI